jgi:hypothetical protein
MASHGANNVDMFLVVDLSCDNAGNVVIYELQELFSPPPVGIDNRYCGMVHYMASQVTPSTRESDIRCFFQKKFPDFLKTEGKGTEGKGVVFAKMSKVDQRKMLAGIPDLNLNPPYIEVSSTSKCEDISRFIESQEFPCAFVLKGQGHAGSANYFVNGSSKEEVIANVNQLLKGKGREEKLLLEKCVNHQQLCDGQMVSHRVVIRIKSDGSVYCQNVRSEKHKGFNSHVSSNRIYDDVSETGLTDTMKSNIETKFKSLAKALRESCKSSDPIFLPKMLPEPGVIDNSVFAVEAARFLSQQHVGIKDNKYKTLARLWEHDSNLLGKCNQVSERLYEVKQMIRDLLNEETICPTSTISEEEAKVYGPKLNLLKFINLNFSSISMGELYCRDWINNVNSENVTSIIEALNSNRKRIYDAPELLARIETQLSSNRRESNYSESELQQPLLSRRNGTQPRTSFVIRSLLCLCGWCGAIEPGSGD